MTEERIESAVRRIEEALGRIAHCADTIRPAPPSVSGLVVRHEALRDEVTHTLAALDELIEGLDH